MTVNKEKLITDLQNAFVEVEKIISILSEEELANRRPGKWSKKEELGHLIDSAINNIKRFTESQFKEKPYPVIGYEQNDLVIANAYQQQKTTDIFLVWKQLNIQVIHLINTQTEETFNYKVILASSNEIKTLAWLMEDYVVHLLHHVKQIKGE